MNKMAIFVEGQTEREFVAKLVLAIAQENSVVIEWRKISGGKTCPRKVEMLGIKGSFGSHFILIFDCGGDGQVKSRMVEEYSGLAKAGYTKIVCCRDVFPDFKQHEIPRLRMGLPLRVKTRPIEVTFVLQVMELEAWFLAEHSHFQRIDPAITPTAILGTLGFDPSADDMQSRDNPASDLSNCYAIGGKTYSKKAAANKKTIDAIDAVSVYFDTSKLFPDLQLFCNTITAFLETSSSEHSSHAIKGPTKGSASTGLPKKADSN